MTSRENDLLKAARKIITKDFDRVREKTEIVPNPGKGLCGRKRRMRGIYRANNFID